MVYVINNSTNPWARIQDIGRFLRSDYDNQEAECITMYQIVNEEDRIEQNCRFIDNITSELGCSFNHKDYFNYIDLDDTFGSCEENIKLKDISIERASLQRQMKELDEQENQELEEKKNRERQKEQEMRTNMRNKCLTHKFNKENLQKQYNMAVEKNIKLNIKNIKEYKKTKNNNPYYKDEPDKYFSQQWIQHTSPWHTFFNINMENYIQSLDEWIKFCKNNNVTTTELYNNLYKNNTNIIPHESMLKDTYLSFISIYTHLGPPNLRRRP